VQCTDEGSLSKHLFRETILLVSYLEKNLMLYSGNSKHNVLNQT